MQTLSVTYKPYIIFEMLPCLFSKLGFLLNLMFTMLSTQTYKNHIYAQCRL